MSSTTLRLALCLALVAAAEGGVAQIPTDPSLAVLGEQQRIEGEQFAVRARALNDRIQRGWPAAAVQQVMGQPERIQRSVDGRDQIEVWGYQGFEVRVQFRNGLVESWFVRFAQ